jgi:hypothetical protein
MNATSRTDRKSGDARVAGISRSPLQQLRTSGQISPGRQKGLQLCGRHYRGRIQVTRCSGDREGSVESQGRRSAPTPQPRNQTANSKATLTSCSNCFAVSSTESVMRNILDFLQCCANARRQAFALNIRCLTTRVESISINGSRLFSVSACDLISRTWAARTRLVPFFDSPVLGLGVRPYLGSWGRGSGSIP